MLSRWLDVHEHRLGGLLKADLTYRGGDIVAFVVRYDEDIIIPTYIEALLDGRLGSSA